jgi:uncharacterized membrane protein
MWFQIDVHISHIVVLGQPTSQLNLSLKLLELYLYIVVSLIVTVFPAYYTPVHVLYIVAFGPYGIQLVYS